MSGRPAKIGAYTTPVIVIDDKPSFAWHVWRAFSGALEFGAPDEFRRDRGKRGDVSSPYASSIDDALSKFDWARSDERYFVAWHDSGKGLATLQERLKNLSIGNRAAALVDMRLGTSEGWWSYEQALRDAKLSKRRIFLLSSYETRVDTDRRPGSLAVWSKTPESLREIQKKIEVRRARSNITRWAKNELHILVTGAGFEFAGDPSATGVPETWKVLSAMDWKMPGTSEGFQEPLEGRYPMPPKAICDSRAAISHKIKDRDLDGYWEEIFAWVDGQNPRLPVEIGLREAFRRALLRYDIGHMSQSVLAADLKWGAWLTTNYTGFADRAIERSPVGVWRSVRTKDDAEISFHPDEHDPNVRLFVKLHGDIGNAKAMAMATRDKQRATTGREVPELGTMYAAAGGWISRSAQLSKRVHWHIVGHALRDRELVRTMGELFAAAPRKHSVLIVAPAPWAADTAAYLAKCLGTPLAKRIQVTVHDAYADEYIRCLHAIVAPR